MRNVALPKPVTMAKQLQVCIDAARAGGSAIEAIKATDAPRTYRKDSISGRHYSIVTTVDYASQAAIFNVLRRYEAPKLITEERVTDPEFTRRLLTESDLPSIRESGAYILDPMDGTRAYSAGLPDFCVPVAYVAPGLQQAVGAIAVPAYGTMYYGSSSGESFALFGGAVRHARVTDTTDLENAYVNVGQDSFVRSKYPLNFELIGLLGGEAMNVANIPSGELALAQLAAGRIDASVQPPQSIWDYAAGRAVVEGAGGTFLFYRISDDGRIVPIPKLEAEHYNPKRKMAGYIAASTQKLAKEIFDMLLELQ